MWKKAGSDGSNSSSYWTLRFPSGVKSPAETRKAARADEVRAALSFPPIERLIRILSICHAVRPRLSWTAGAPSTPCPCCLSTPSVRPLSARRERTENRPSLTILPTIGRTTFRYKIRHFLSQWQYRTRQMPKVWLSRQRPKRTKVGAGWQELTRHCQLPLVGLEPFRSSIWRRIFSLRRAARISTGSDSSMSE